jgi:DNA-binding transcriptional LysR family regulator
MIKLDGLVLFTAIAEAGSISAGGRRLGLPKSVASERLAELERALGGTLVQRTTRKLTLTEDGEAFLQRARAILRDVEDATAELAQRRGQLVGPLRVSAPVSFSALHLGTVLAGFLIEHPAIELTLDLDDRFVDVVADGFDAVIRHGRLHEPRFHSQKLATSRRVLVASPAYLAKRGAPASVADLHAADAILYSNRDVDWRFEAAGGVTSVRPRAAMRVNNGLIMHDAALAGLGVALLPEFFVYREIAAGDLCVVDAGAEPEAADIVLACPFERAKSAKITALAAHLRRAFGDPPYWQLPR